MSTTVYIKFDRKIAGYEPQDRCSLAYAFFEPRFEEIARQLAVPPLATFYSSDPADLDHEIDDPNDRELLKKKLGPAQYFSPTEGLISVRAILDQVRKKPFQLKRRGTNRVQNLAVELAEVETALQLAEEQGAKFYFEVGE